MWWFLGAAAIISAVLTAIGLIASLMIHVANRAQFKRKKATMELMAAGYLSEENAKHARNRDVLLASGDADGLAKEHDRHQAATREIADAIEQIRRAKSDEDIRAASEKERAEIERQRDELKKQAS